MVRISTSWTAPHRVIFQGNDKFFGRTSAGKYELNVDELRIAFSLSETIKERIRLFRVDRILKIEADETPTSIECKQRVVIHIIPIISFHSSKEFNIKTFDTLPPTLKRVYTNISDISGSESRYNFEGILLYPNPHTSLKTFYVQLYRNGIIEAVETNLTYDDDKSKKLILVSYENYIKDFVKYHLDKLRSIDVLPPYIICLSLLGFKGFRIKLRVEYSQDSNETIATDTLMIPECIVQDTSDSIEKVLRQTFDIVWNSCGKDRSYNYDENGVWKPQEETIEYSE